MQDVYADSNEGMVVKLIISVGQGEKKTPRKPTQVRVNWFQNLVWLSFTKLSFSKLSLT